jgi:hypothetical protein
MRSLRTDDHQWRVGGGHLQPRTTPVARQEKSAACASARNRRRPALRHRDTRAYSFRQGNRCAGPSGSGLAVLLHPAAREAQQDRPVPPDRRHPDRPSGQAGRADPGRLSDPDRIRRGRITQAPSAKRPTKSVAGVPLFPSVYRHPLCHVLGTATSVPHITEYIQCKDSLRVHRQRTVCIMRYDGSRTGKCGIEAARRSWRGARHAVGAGQVQTPK